MASGKALSFGELMALLSPEDVLAAARVIDDMEIPPTRQGTYYEALVEGRAYPPKLLLENAVAVLSLRTPRVPRGWGHHGSGFNGGPQTNGPLARLGFKVRDRRVIGVDEEAVEHAAEALDDDAMERESVLRSIAVRRGQPAFRDALLQQYEGRCAFSGWDVVSSLEAAHVVPYANNGGSKVTNGLLLRGDLHTLFDLHLITVDPDSRTVVVAQELQMTKAAELHGRPLAWPLDAKAAPPREVLARHHALAMAKSNRATPNADEQTGAGSPVDDIDSSQDESVLMQLVELMEG